MYDICYSWRGEDHRTLEQHKTIAEARKVLVLFIADNWRAWIERV